MPKAYIVWNADKSEGVIFVEDGQNHHHMNNASEDAGRAAGGERRKPVESALAIAFDELYEGEGTSIQAVDANELYGLFDAHQHKTGKHIFDEAVKAVKTLEEWAADNDAQTEAYSEDPHQVKAAEALLGRAKNALDAIKAVLPE